MHLFRIFGMTTFVLKFQKGSRVLSCKTGETIRKLLIAHYIPHVDSASKKLLMDGAKDRGVEETIQIQTINLNQGRRGSNITPMG